MLNRVLLGLGCYALSITSCASETADGGAMMMSAATAGSNASPMSAAAPTQPSTATKPSAAMQPTEAATPSTGMAAAAQSAMIASDETWSDGKMFSGSVDIAAGAKVTIAPGAKISFPAGASVTVHGSLGAAAKDNHAKLSGMGWMGIVVAQAGSLSLSGVDVEGAKQAILVSSGNTLAEYNYGTVSDGLFKIDAGGSLSLDHVAVKQGGYTFVSGSLKASFLDYSGTGIALGAPMASAVVSDSKLTGTGPDFFTANGGQLLHVEYSTVDSSHCPFHFNTLTKFEIDHVTTGATNAYGWMIYNGDAGPHSISNSNINDPSWEQTRPSAVVNVTHTFIKNAKTKAGQVTFTPADASGNNAQTEPNADAQPRGTPGPG